MIICNFDIPRISLVAARVNKKMTQQQLAECMSVSKHLIFKWENGQAEPSASQLRKLSEITGIPIDFLYIPEPNTKNE